MCRACIWAASASQCFNRTRNASRSPAAASKPPVCSAVAHAFLHTLSVSKRYIPELWVHTHPAVAKYPQSRRHYRQHLNRKCSHPHRAQMLPATPCGRDEHRRARTPSLHHCISQILVMRGASCLPLKLLDGGSSLRQLISILSAALLVRLLS